ncbi:unnamed protein product [Microthlaspi erraticum]|uniref:Uncharacterized protein n=1 Tax=Microthlaspi erraticum TaxID=1685480 RepID=A0A6D2KE69_9BRAS|nr:unnamed protein product [Microthlaspi erraticum]
MRFTHKTVTQTSRRTWWIMRSTHGGGTGDMKKSHVNVNETLMMLTSEKNRAPEDAYLGEKWSTSRLKSYRKRRGDVKDVDGDQRKSPSKKRGCLPQRKMEHKEDAYLGEKWSTSRLKS